MSKPRFVPPADGPKRDVYARFIPREELSSFAAWDFGDVSSNEPGPTTPGARRSDPEAAPLDPAAQLTQQLRAARQSGYQDGYRDGLAALEGFKQSFAAQTTSQVGALLGSIGHGLDALQQDMASALAAAATSLARQILRSELATDPTTVARVAEQAIEALLLSARHIVLRVHPDDQALVAAGAAEVIAERGIRIVADAQISRGGCLIESDIGLVDATIEERWRRGASGLGSDEPWRAAAADAAPDAAAADDRHDGDDAASAGEHDRAPLP
jgi:flagellar assembly protein FliH